jgi:two-component system chemotaxis response regulator CheB
MQGCDIIVIGASLGGIEAVSQLLAELPRELNAAVFVVLHIGAHENRLATVFNRQSKLPVSQAVNGEDIKHGHVYLAAPDNHLILTPGGIRLVHGRRENFARPAIDALFRSAALAFGPRVVGVVLTGGRSDGAAGLLAIKDCGGVCIVQDPADAVAPSMPSSALARVNVDHCAPLSQIPALLINYDPPTVAVDPPPPLIMQLEHKLSTLEITLPDEREMEQIGEPSALTCPECGAVLYTIRDLRLLRYRCAAGHGMTAEALLDKFTETREERSWAAIRAITEEATLLRQLAGQEGISGVERSGQLRWAEKLDHCADQIENVIVSPNG